MFTFRSIGYNCLEDHPMRMRRPQGLYEFYLLLYIKMPITLYLERESVFCRPGSLILFPPFAPQNWDTHATRMTHHFCTFELEDPDYFNNLEIPLNTPLFLNANKELDALFRTLAEEFHSARIGKLYKVDSILNDYFVTLARKLHLSGTEKNEYTMSVLQQFEDLRLRIYEDPSQDVAQYAAQAGFSTRRFEHYYRLFFELSPKEEIDRARLQMAKDKLLEGQPPELLAAHLGFGSPEYFTKWFRKNTGLSPKRFAERKRQPKP